MESSIPIVTVSKPRLWTGRIISGLCILFLLFDGVIKLMNLAPVVQPQAKLGIPGSQTLGIGIAVLVCAVVYATPQTAVLGAILLTGYLGGAIAIQVRISADLFSVLFPGIFSVLVWAGLFLREGRLGDLVPVRR